MRSPHAAQEHWRSPVFEKRRRPAAAAREVDAGVLTPEQAGELLELLVKTVVTLCARGDIETR